MLIYETKKEHTMRQKRNGHFKDVYTTLWKAGPFSSSSARQ